MGIFAKFGTMKGDATLGEHAEWTVINGFEWAGGAPSNLSEGTARTGRIAFKAAVFTKSLDSTSVPLLEAMARNSELNEVKVHFTNGRAGSDGDLVCEIIFRGAHVIDVKYVGGESTPGELTSIFFRSFEMTYFDAESGAGLFSFTHDL